MKTKLGILSIVLLGVALSACTNLQPTAVVTGAISKHIKDDKQRDEINPLLAVEFNNHIRCGIYDNSRLKPSASVFCTEEWLDYATPSTPITLTSKVGLAYYDNKSGYPSSFKPIFAVGSRLNINRQLFVDLDYMPQSLIGKTDVASLTVSYRFGGMK